MPVVVMLLTACTVSPASDERWQATPDKSQPAVAVVPPAPLQQIRPQQAVLEPDRATERRTLEYLRTPHTKRETEDENDYLRGQRAAADVAVDANEFLLADDERPPSLPPRAAARALAELQRLVPTFTSDEVPELKATVRPGAVRVVGQARTHEDVAELMLSLKKLVWVPNGIARELERQRNGPRVRVELLTGEHSVQDCSTSDAQPVAVEILSAELHQLHGRELLTFELELSLQ